MQRIEREERNRFRLASLHSFHARDNILDSLSFKAEAAVLPKSVVSLAPGFANLKSEIFINHPHLSLFIVITPALETCTHSRPVRCLNETHTITLAVKTSPNAPLHLSPLVSVSVEITWKRGRKRDRPGKRGQSALCFSSRGSTITFVKPDQTTRRKPALNQQQMGGGFAAAQLQLRHACQKAFRPV